MEQNSIKLVAGKDACGAAERIADNSGRDAFVAQCLGAAQDGDSEAFFELGMAFSAGSDLIAVDLVEAHKWFNLAAVGGHDCAAQGRADVAEDMTAREIAEAQRRAREWLRTSPALRVA